MCVEKDANIVMVQERRGQCILFVQFSIEEVEKVVSLYKDGVKIEGLSIDDTAGNASPRNKLMVIEVIAVEEIADAVKVGILTQILEDIGSEICFPVNREENAIAIEFVFGQDWTVSKRTG